MSYFRVQPNVLRVQSEELEAVYGRMCRDVAEISGVLQRLRDMSAFDEVSASLRRVQQKATAQYTELRQCARTLEQVAELYVRAEGKNLDGAVSAVRSVRRVTSSLPAAQSVMQSQNPTGPASGPLSAWNVPSTASAQMLPFAEELLGCKVYIPESIEV